MNLLLLFAQATMHTLAPGIPQAVPPTRFSCTLMDANGGHFTVAGTTPAFPKGWDPNSAKYVTLESSHAEAFKGQVGIDPGDAGDWFREFQVASQPRGGLTYMMTLKLRRDGTSAAYTTRYESTGKQVPYDYHAAGVCKADFAPAAAAEERG